MVEIDGSRGGCGPPAGRAGMAVFERTLAEGNTRKPRALGIASVRKGRRPIKVVHPGEAESVQVGIAEARRCPRRRPTDGALLLRRNRWLKVPFARLPHSEASPAGVERRRFGGS
jgi:hypothetical protein